MRMTNRLVVVTGGNRGIGLETGRQLARQGLQVILGCRDLSAGEQAAADIGRDVGAAASSGSQPSVEARLLDVTDPRSIDVFAKRLGDEGRSPWAVVNNAGVSLRGFNADIAARTLEVNFYGAARLTDALIPILGRGARVVMVSSGMGELSAFAPPLRDRFLDPALDRDGVERLAQAFLEHVRRGEHEQRGWPSSAYRVSKALMNALVRLLAGPLREHGILVNAVCPGWVRTDLGGGAAPRSVEEGAASVVWTVMLPDDGPTGGFFRDGHPIRW